MSKPKFIKEIEKFEGKERAKCGRWYIRVYGELDHKPMVELESLEIVIKELHKLEEENKKLKERINTMQEFIDYSEGVVQNAIGMLYEEGGEDKALDYLENCYATGDDKQYEEMERLYKDV